MRVGEPQSKVRPLNEGARNGRERGGRAGLARPRGSLVVGRTADFASK